MHGKKSSRLTYLKLIIAIAIFGFLFYKSQLSLKPLIAIIHQPTFILFSILLFCISILVNAFRWYRLNSAQAISLNYSQTVLPTYLGISFNNILPGSIGGDFVRLYYLFQKFPQKKSGAALSVLFDRFCGLISLFLIAAIIGIIQFNRFKHESTLFYLLIVCIATCLSVISLFILSIFLLEKIKLIPWLNRKFSKKTWFPTVNNIFAAINIYKNAKWTIVECLGISILGQLVLVAIILLINNMLNLPALSLSDYVIALVVAQIANLIPLTPGGLGIGEAAFANTLLLLNPDTAGAYATIFLVFRLLNTLISIPGVALGMLGSIVLREGKLNFIKYNLNEEKIT